jgi:hypothetical protein
MEAWEEEPGQWGARLHHGRKVLELCPRGNNKDIIIIIFVHDNVYIPC